MDQNLIAFWHSIDLILCINLKERRDRRNESSEIFARCGIPVTYHETVRDPISGTRGCFTEHIACIDIAYKQGCGTVAIFEDDADMLLRPSAAALAELNRFFKENHTWDLFFLGAFPDIFTQRTESLDSFPNIRRVHSKLGHAYIVSRRGMEKFRILRYDTVNEPIDHIYARNKNAYAIFPTWFYQTESRSDLSNHPRWPRFVRKGAVYIRSQYGRYINFPLAPLLIGIGVVLGVLLLVLLLFTFRKTRIQARQIALIKTQQQQPAPERKNS